MDKLALYSEIFSKLAAEKLYLYTFVPKVTLESIKSKGLLSAEKLVQNPKALQLARKDPEKFKQQVQEDKKDPDWKDLVGAVSTFFTLPDWSKLPKSHNIFKMDLVPIKINLSQLMKDHPDTRLFGVELEKFNPKLDEQPNREKNLSLKEIKSYVEELPEVIWRHYDASKKKMYAPDVPHLMIITKMKKIPAEYLIL
jgi:hypothetical protein